MTEAQPFALVLGAGGTVGMGYHTGVLKALFDHGFDAARAELLIGTSAGSVIAAYLRSGWTVADLWDLAMGTHSSIADLSPEEQAAQRRAMLAPTWGNPVELVRRTMGSAAVVARAVLPAMPTVPAPLAKQFPGGLFSMEEVRERFESEVGTAWPARETWICAHDLRSGRRIVFGSDSAPRVELPTAVMASCAIPGFFRPIRAAGMSLVDGGVHSTTHLDLAAVAGHRRIIGIAPMGFDPAEAPGSAEQLRRRLPARALSREAKLARRLGAEVTLFRPGSEELRVHGGNLMNPDVADAVARCAYDVTCRQLGTERFRPLIAA